jgi:GTPase KRas protein
MTKMEYGFDLHDVEIIDTAGQEEFLSFRDSSISRGDGFLGLFAINSLSSWYDLKNLRTKIIRDHDDDPVPMVIVANKSVSCLIP